MVLVILKIDMFLCPFTLSPHLDRAFVILVAIGLYDGVRGTASVGYPLRTICFSIPLPMPHLDLALFSFHVRVHLCDGRNLRGKAGKG